METNPHNPVGEGTPTVTIQPAPLDVIRTETVLSKLPIHNLAKKGRVNIQISKMGPDGQVELKWEVSYSDRYGQARQLAYKLDTIVIDQKVEEAGKPLPERIRLGSLHEICRDLGLTEGENKNSVKRAFHQNASAYITAKLKYKSNDGTEHTFEAGFTRYTVIFTGEKFEDGSRADAVYIELHPRYREVLNNAPVRPLDLGYKKELPPGPQRFYEIVSYKVFAALKYNQPFARLAYSEYCTFSAQQRYFDYDHFKKQMYKIHRPHLVSGYIAKIHYDQATDDQGQADWTMCYVPGPKARAEFATFSGKKPKTIDAAILPAGEKTAPARQPRQRRLHLQAAVEFQPPTIVHYQMVAELAKRGVGEQDARQLLSKLPPDQPVADQLEYGDYQISQARGTNGAIRNEAGFYIYILQHNIPVPPTFISPRVQKTRQEAQEAQAEAIRKAQADQLAAEEAETQSLTAQIENLPTETRLALMNQAKTDLLSRQPKMAHYLKTHPEADSVIRARARAMLKDGWTTPTPQPENPHYAINPPIRQATPLQETAPAAPVLDLERILKTPQLSAPEGEPEPAAQPPELTIDVHLL